WVSYALGQLTQFLDVHNGHYRLFHTTFPEFLTAPLTRTTYPDCYLDASEWHAHIVKSYKAKASQWNQVDWLHVDDYALHHLAAHLAELQSAPNYRNELYELICQSFMHTKLARFRSHQSFASDVRMMLDVAEGDPDNGLPQTIRGHLIEASLNVLARSIPTAILPVLVEIGQVARAQSLTALIPDAAQRGQAHCQIAGALLTRGAVAAADAELDQALAVSARIEDDLERMSLQVTIGKISSRKHLPDEAAFVHHIIKRAVDLAASLARLD